MTEKELVDLDLSVATIERGNLSFDMGPVTRLDSNGVACEVGFVNGHNHIDGGEWHKYSPTRDPVEAMRLLQKHRLSVEYTGGPWDFWACEDVTTKIRVTGATPMIAICRAVVAIKS